MSEGLGDFFKLVAEDKKKKKEEFKEEVKNLGLNSIFGEIAAEKKRIKEEKERELQAKIDEEKRKQDEFNKIVGKIDTNSLFQELAQAKKESTIEEAEEKARQQKVLLSFENFLTKKIDDIEEIQEEVEEIVEEEEELVEEEVVEEEPSLIEKSLGMLSEPTEKIGAEENFATLDDLRNHYKEFLGKIQQQLSTLGGGGENNTDGFEYVSDKNLESNPIALAADTWTKVTNDGTSSSTKRNCLPEGVTRIYDVTTDRIKLDQLPTTGWLIFRFGVKVLPNVDNVTLKARIAYTLPDGFKFYLVAPGALLNDGAGIEYEEQFTLTFYVGDQESKDGFGELEVRADGTCSITDCAFMTIVG